VLVKVQHILQSLVLLTLLDESVRGNLVCHRLFLWHSAVLIMQVLIFFNWIIQVGLSKALYSSSGQNASLLEAPTRKPRPADCDCCRRSTEVQPISIHIALAGV
jgi:hypothetical protein